MNNLIDIQNLEFGYGNDLLLKIPSWQLKQGERIFLAGPSGSGKTTFLEIISGILQPQKGQYQFEGKDLISKSSTERDEVRKQSMSLIFQNFNLVPYLNVEENILLPFWLGYKDSRSEIELKKEISVSLEKLGLRGMEYRKITELSQGQQQRVAAARAFLKRPKLLLADEPTSALDMDHREAFLKVLFEMAEASKTSLIFVSHDRNLEKLFHSTLSINDWRV